MKSSKVLVSGVIFFLFFLTSCGLGDVNNEPPFLNENNQQNGAMNEEITNDEGVEADITETDTSFDGMENPLTVHYIDVGQGDATLLETSDTVILIDAGRHDQNDVVPYLDNHEIDQINLLVGTHPHADHIGQLKEVIDQFDVEEIWMSGAETTSKTFEESIDAILSSNASYYEPRAGENFNVGPFTITVLHPKTLTNNLNDNSISLKIEFGEIAFLFTGDGEVAAEQIMLANNYDLTAQIYKAGHHGSSTSSSEAFVNEVNPEVAIIHSGKDNQYGHPHRETIDLFIKKEIPVYGTAIHGTIMVTTDGQDYEVRVERNGAIDGFLTGSTNRDGDDDIEEPNNSEAQGDCININVAAQEQLVDIVHVGEARAQQIVNLRPFEDISDLKRVNGISDNRLNDIKEQGLICDM